METTARALYEFNGVAGNEELSFDAGEIIAIINKDVGEGWWQGRKSDGTVGLFPEAYVEEEAASQAEPAAFQVEPAAFQVEPAAFQAEPVQHFNQNGGENQFQDNDAEPQSQIVESNDAKPWEAEEGYNDGGGDTWADDFNTQPTPAVATAPVAVTSSPSFSDSSVKRSDRKTTVKAGKTLFSTFTKTAGESYILGEMKFDSKEAKSSRIVICNDGPMWDTVPGVFSCTVSDPVKESKFSGFKSFIAYHITPSHMDNGVLRRFKHFDWLYEQLARKYGIAVAVPTLPDKQITGRYEEDFIEERRSQLEAWISRMGLHPVISQAEVLQHFVTSKDDEKAWKAGKRKAEKDDAVGGAFLNTVETPDHSLDLSLAEQTLETNVKFTRGMEEACKNMLALGHEQAKKYISVYRKDYEKLGQTFHLFSESFALDEREVAAPLTEAMKHTGECFHTIGELYDGQPKYDWNPFLTGLNEYKSVLSTFPSILGNQKSALDKNKEVRKLQLESKVTPEEMEDAATRTEKLSYVVQAEINHFQHYRVGDFAVYMKNFLQQQIAFHQEIIKKLEEAASDYREMVQS